VYGFAGHGVQRSHATTSLKKKTEQQRKEWIDSSVQYYRTVMREERRREMGLSLQPEQNEDYLHLAKRHYFARYKIKNGAPKHAEVIYRKIIDDLTEDEDQCDHAQLAVTTLLLALVLQRQRDAKATRSVFLRFFRLAFVEEYDDQRECACSAKVLQAYALFEMKQGHSLKALDLATKAVKLDKSLSPVLEWKQFRDARARLRGRMHHRKKVVE